MVSSQDTLNIGNLNPSPIAEILRRRQKKSLGRRQCAKSDHETSESVDISSDATACFKNEKPNVSSDTLNIGNSNPPPIAEILRKRQKRALGSRQCAKSDHENSNIVDIDEEIKRLEQELAANSSPSSDEESSEEEAAVVCLSAVAHERIDPLPAHVLPSNKRRRLKIDQADELPTQAACGNRDSEGKTRFVKKKGKRDPKPRAEDKSSMLAAVKEMIAGYVARSSERIPFYCRVCQVQSDNESQFLMHKQTELHKLAVKEEQKASYCKVCRKQLTSVVQLQEHLSSKPHRDRMEYLQATQPRKTKINWKSPTSSNYQHYSQDKRQWC